MQVLANKIPGPNALSKCFLVKAIEYKKFS